MEQGVIFTPEGVSMKSAHRIISVFALLALLLAAATPVYAFDGRTGDNLVIQEGQVINDDLYVGAQNFTLDGTVKGDLIVGAQTVIVNGTVEGDLIVGAQTVIINGTVKDDARLFVAAVQLGDRAQVGGDLVAMGASLEARRGSRVGSDLVTGGGQALLAGEVGRNVLAGTGGLEVTGVVGGNIAAYVNVDSGTADAPPMNLYMNNSPITLPRVKPGLTISDQARIAGNLDYTSKIDLQVPAGSVGGKISRLPVTTEGVEVRTPTQGERVADWIYGLLRTMITVLLFGLLCIWLFPRFMKLLPQELKNQPLPSLGWGAIAFAAVFFAVFAIVLVTTALIIAGLHWNMFWLGWLLLSALGIAFFLATSFLAKVVVGDAVGKWILARIYPAAVNHAVWPMVTGVVVLVLVIGLLRFPLLPLGFFGWLLNFGVILFGLGALWIWASRLWASRKTVPMVPAQA
jgi:cytoskeletal protein CcmA (bactofilin family)